ncbi:hypothetical protein R3W88_022513 [Solanum pinnatisectum]|uniref:Endonuclease/exonuclease/phosphatase domain-containing protein n=1 Tax=Solanum pinnatisectum TaxID=50273 RepID=A0AAV9LXP9_9SOLN|nr:hypothetical protein R3W88_022513 [Solanum pinnatisectum]
MTDPHTPILFLRNPLTLDMLQSTEKKYQVRVPQVVRKESITIRHYNSQIRQKYVAIIIPTLKGKQVMDGENITKLDSNMNLEMFLTPGGSSNSQEGIIMKMLLWNCRGAHSSNFMNNMCALIEWNNPTILALTEMRMEDHDNLLQALDFTDVIQILAIGYSGGIALLWKSSEVTIEPFMLTEQEIHATIEVSMTSPKWTISIVYAKNSNITTSITGPWLVCGDFNEVTNALENLGGSPINNTKCSAFINCLDDMNMIYLGFTSLKYTCNHEWLNLFPKSTVQHLPRTHSDHCPVLLNCTKSVNKPNKIFRFESMWLRHPDFSNVVRKTWGNNKSYSNALENFTKATRIWNRKTFGNIFKQTKDVLKRINELQRMDENYKKPFHIYLEEKLIKEYNEILKREEEFWKLKSRVQWLNDGDANTKFFHISTTNRRRRNRIIGLNDSVGNWTFDLETISNTIVHHFKTIYTTELIKCDLENPKICVNALSMEDGDLIGRPLEKNEIKKMLFSPLNLLNHRVQMDYIHCSSKNIGKILRNLSQLLAKRFF